MTAGQTLSAAGLMSLGRGPGAPRGGAARLDFAAAAGEDDVGVEALEAVRRLALPLPRFDPRSTVLTSGQPLDRRSKSWSAVRASVGRVLQRRWRLSAALPPPAPFDPRSAVLTSGQPFDQRSARFDQRSNRRWTGSQPFGHGSEVRGPTARALQAVRRPRLTSGQPFDQRSNSARAAGCPPPPFDQRSTV